MIALAEQTALSWAEETSWGARKKNGASPHSPHYR